MEKFDFYNLIYDTKSYLTKEEEMKLKAVVDTDIINAAQKGSTCDCLLALSMFRLGMRSIKVTKDSIKGRFDNRQVICSVTPKLAQTIEDFDAGKKVRPFTATLNFALMDPPKQYKKASAYKKKTLKKRGVKKGSKWSKYRYQGVAQLSK